ncbi:MCE family protein [Actinomadura verrucosospora]|uniref:Virulence factor Mce family protein n=1 Tax=Actinomadura verrucosospora TaxID=46165 RepID=A0A7D3W010_ACTVE|nr:MCE family protein [Actinomadura verrucosospora]QKG27090.1 virulence factor Mce family protein [Actinomadura verrucosospora]
MIRRSPVLSMLFAALLAAALAVALAQHPPGTRITAWFTSGIGVFPKSSVRVLGVSVGHVDSVTPRGPRVKVTMTVDHGVKIPAAARAIIVAPSLVSDRYIQLAPAYTGGATLTGGTVLDTDRTAVPLELDQLYDAVRAFSRDLAPNGKYNPDGALSQAIGVGAANLKGNGKKLNDTVEALSKLFRTLDGSGDDLFGTVHNLADFSGMLADNDHQVRTAEQQLATVSSFLADDRDELASTLSELSAGLARVKVFIAGNRALLKKDVDKLAKLTRTITDRRAALAEALDTAPLAASNALNAYDPLTGSLMARANLLEVTAAYGRRGPGPLCGTAAPGACGPAAKAGGSPLPLPLPAAGGRP